MGKLVTVWDGNIKVITEALTDWDKSGKVIVLTDSQVAIAAIRNAGNIGKARIGELRKVIRRI